MNHFIKICGITSKEDALMVEAEGADAIGFILHEESDRFIEIEKVADIVECLNNDLDIFLVFVNKAEEFVANCLDKIPRAIPQFHGDEDAEFCSKFNEGFVKAVRVNAETNFDNINNTIYSYEIKKCFDCYFYPKFKIVKKKMSKLSEWCNNEFNRIRPGRFLNH